MTNGIGHWGEAGKDARRKEGIDADDNDEEDDDDDDDEGWT